MNNNYYNNMLELLLYNEEINWIKFDQMAGDVLREAGYEESDLENMSVDDVVERIGEMMRMKLESDEDNVYVVEYINS